MMRTLKMVVLTAVLVGSTTPALAGPPDADTQATTSESVNRVSGVEVDQKSDGTYLKLESSETPSFSVFKLKNPLRLVVDVSNSRLEGNGTLREIEDRVVSRVSLLENQKQNGRRVRLIVGFERPTHYDVRTSGDDVVIFVERGGSGAGTASSDENEQPGSGSDEQQLAATRDEVEKMQSEVESVRGDLSEARGEISELRSELKRAKKSSEKKRLRGQIESAENRADRLQQKLDRKSQNVASLKQRVQTLEKRLSEQKSKARERARKLEELRDRREQWNEQLDEQTEKYEQAAREVETKEQKLEELRSDLEQLKRERDQSEGEQKKRLEQRLEERASDVREMKRELDSKRETVGSLEGEVQRLERQRNEARQEMAALKKRWKNRLEESEERYEQASEELNETKQRLQTAKREIASLREQKATATGKDRRELESKLSEKTAELDDMKSELDALRSTRSKLEQRLEESRERKRRAKASARKHRENTERARRKLETYEKQLAERDRKLSKLKSKLDTLRDQAESSGDGEKAERVRTLEQKLEKLRATRDRQREELAELRNEQSQQSTEETAGAARAVPVGSETSRDESSESSNRIRDIRLETEDGTSRIVVELEDPGTYKRLPWKESRAVMLLKNVELPERLEQTIAAGESGAVRFVSSYSDSNGEVRMEAELDSKARERIEQNGDRIVWEFAPEVGGDGSGRAGSAGEARRADSSQRRPERPEQGTNQTGAPPNYPRSVTNPAKVDGVPGMSRKRLTIDLRGADIQNVLRLFAKEGGVNIVAGDEISGTVTLRLKDVPLDEAFLIVLQSLGLGFEKRGEVIRVATQEKLLKEKKARQKARQREQKTQPLEVFLLPVNYAQADEMSDQVKRLLSPRGSVSVDERTNTMIIKDLPANIRSIRKLVSELDSQVPQVLIEARIVETNDTFSQEFGIQWGGDFTMSQGGGNPTGLVFPNVLGASGGATDGETPTQGTAENPNFAVNLPAPAGTGSGGALGLTMGSVSGAVNLNLRLSAAEEAGRAKIVSAPKILTLDNREATISQGTSIPISVVSAAGVQTVFVDATLELTVTPHVTPDGNVQMEIDATKNEPDFQNTGARGDPTIIRKQAETELLIEDGETTVIGGIYTRNTGRSVTGIPVLHQIPILGLLFKSTSSSERRTELLIFITPRVVNRAEALGDQSAGNVVEGGASTGSGSAGGNGGGQ